MDSSPTLNVGGYIGAVLGAVLGTGTAFLLLPLHALSAWSGWFAVVGMVIGATTLHYHWPRLWKRPFRFSLRTLFIAVTVLAVLCGGIVLGIARLKELSREINEAINRHYSRERREEMRERLEKRKKEAGDTAVR